MRCIWRLPFVILEIEAGKRTLLGCESNLPSRLRLRFALILAGRSEGEGGRGNPPVEPEPSLRPVSLPINSAEDPEFQNDTLSLKSWALVAVPTQRLTILYVETRTCPRAGAAAGGLKLGWQRPTAMESRRGFDGPPHDAVRTA